MLHTTQRCSCNGSVGLRVTGRESRISAAIRGATEDFCKQCTPAECTSIRDTVICSQQSSRFTFSIFFQTHSLMRQC